VKTRCSKCHTRYEIDLDAVLAADGMARCFRCGTVFNALTEEVGLGEALDRHDYQKITPDGEAARGDVSEDDIPWTDLPEAEIPEFDTARRGPPADLAPDIHAHDIPGAELPDLRVHDTEIPEPGSELRDAPASDLADADSLQLVFSAPDARARGIIERAHAAPQAPAATPHVPAAEVHGPVEPGVDEAQPQTPEVEAPQTAAPDVQEMAHAEPEAEQAGPAAPGTSAPDTSAPGAAAAPHPPIEIPEDLEPLQPSDEVPRDVLESLTERRSWHGFFYGLLAILLVVGLGLQLAWQYRAELVDRYPVLQPVCEHIECRPTVVHAPQQFRVLHRKLSPTPDTPGSLTLNLRFRNEAQASQPLPEIQLTLLDINGSVVIRRRLAAQEYTAPAPPPDALVAPGEVVTIDLDFKDPGSLASSFEIDFF